MSLGVIFAVGMTVTGSVNTITAKLADVTNSTNLAGQFVPFQHPFFQADIMFFGELTCLFAFYIWVAWSRYAKKQLDLGPQKFNPLIFLPPACCDMTATSVMYLGLIYTTSSSYQMLRGSLILFTALLSVIFLKRKLVTHHWVGIFLVVCGLVLVGVASILLEGASAAAPNPLLGDILIIAAQVVVAVQMVVEEKFISKHQVPPLQVVGFEGLFGFSILSTLLVVMYYIPSLDLSTSTEGNHFENTLDAFAQIKNSPVIIGALGGNLVSIAFFNFCGVSVTKYFSATTRVVLDSIRTVVIWGFSLIVGWEKFEWVELIGFVVLLAGTFVYNNIIIAPALRSLGVLAPEKAAPAPINDEDKVALIEPAPGVEKKRTINA